MQTIRLKTIDKKQRAYAQKLPIVRLLSVHKES